MNTRADFRARIKAAFQGVLNQSSIILGLFLAAILIIISIVAKCLVPIASTGWLPIASSILIAVLAIAVVGGLVAYLLVMDTTESAEIDLGGGAKIKLKSPGKNLLPSILDRLRAQNVRPDRLIPPGADIKGNPEQFQSLSPEEQEKIVESEAATAFGEAINRPTETPDTG